MAGRHARTSPLESEVLVVQGLMEAQIFGLTERESLQPFQRMIDIDHSTRPTFC